jgi:hypothetical protein
VAKTGAPEVRLEEVRVREVCLTEVCLVEVRFAKVQLAEVRTTEIRHFEIHSFEIQLEVGQVRALEIGTYFAFLIPPVVPGLDTLLENLHVLRVGHGTVS